MNRFRTKKKAKDEATDTEQTTMPSFKGFLRGKKAQEEEPKKKIDLEHALPSHDEFRTSLLMTGLSARFSMLREQDDPNTKIGKASDDSVLFPKRSSGMMGFGYGGGLTDIAEVESIKAPFARMDSYSDDAHSTKGSIMDRGKPTEGNNLFGGRQKIVVGTRTVYESDVATSSFQKWRREEKERKMLNGDYDGDDKDENENEASAGSEIRSRPSEEDSFNTRSESPILVGYNRRRETSSTTSSSLARNSSAATSVTSQPTPSIKDWQSQSTAPTSASSTPALDRSVTRTRRLYEQSLNQDMHDHQSSALSRIDTLTGRRGFGTRTPDLSNNAPSPTGFGFGDRRAILTKASAPNLRSVSPPATASSAGTPDLGIKVSNLAETRINFMGSPPLSPPISETGEAGALPIQPNDRGKATAMGVFQKPSLPYDESKYAERQLRLQQGRETPVQRTRTESNTSGRSRSSSSTKRKPLASKAALTVQTAPKEHTSPFTFLDDSDASPLPAEPQSRQVQPAAAPVPVAPQLTLQRPSDKDHPAFRSAALPTPLSLDGKSSVEPSPVSEQPEPSRGSREGSPIDSPTLGPVSGLSGMVRQHMRTESNTSSVYGGPQSSELDARFPGDTRDSSILGVLGAAKVTGWQDQQWNPYQEDTIPEQSPVSDEDDRVTRNKTRGGQHFGSETPSNRSSNDMDKEEDEFASQLASARRRVQQRLTSYVESDSSRSNSPHPPAEPAREVIPPSRPNPLGLLRGKSSRGSLVERNRDASQSKAMKMLGLGASTMSTTPSPGRTSFEEVGLPPMKEEEPAPAREIHDGGSEDERDADAVSAKSQDKEEENVHPGLRAFRQARRELQRRKELESLARHPPQMQAGPADTSPVPEREREMGRTQRGPSRDRKPPPVYYQQRAPSEESSRSGNNSRGPSRPSSRNERDRSGSDTSNGRSHSRPPRLQPNGPYDDHRHGGPPNGGPRPPMMRSPGLPGTDIRRSPIMPPQPYPHNGVAASPRQRFDRSESAGSLAVQSNRGGLEPVSPVQLSPLTPTGTGLPTSPFMNGATGGSPAHGGGHRRPSAPTVPGQPMGPTGFSTTTSTLNESMKRVVKKEDISDPTLVMSTSRVNLVNLPHSSSSPDASSGGRSRSASRAGGYNPPPLPPINPRRKQQDGPGGRGMIGGYIDSGPSPSNYSAPHLPFSSSSGSSVGGRSSPASSSPRAGRDDPRGNTFFEDGGDHRWRHRKTQHGEAHGYNGSGAYPSMRDARATFAAAGPPVSRSVVTPSMKPASGGPMGVPGGMI